MEERILVPLDGTEIGEAVLPKLEDLVLNTTPKMEAEITLLQVISKINFNVLTEDEAAQLPISQSDKDRMIRETNEYLGSIADRLRAKNIKVKTMVTFGHAAEEIVRVARENRSHLIAMATHGRSGFVRWAIGSVTDKVIRLEGKIPVLAVHASDKQEEKTTLPMESLQSLMKHS
ncbi:MAG: universal stress protein [Dehalococcoidales bacterium]|nr:universal stress protein [Dehalococcoidales bacterium]